MKKRVNKSVCCSARVRGAFDTRKNCFFGANVTIFARVPLALLRTFCACIMNASMESHCLPFSKIPHTTKLFSTFAENFDEVAAYYGEPPTVAGVLAAARKIKLDENVRRAVVEVLREQNDSLRRGSGHHAKSGTAGQRSGGYRHRATSGTFRWSGVQPLQSHKRGSICGGSNQGWSR